MPWTADFQPTSDQVDAIRTSGGTVQNEPAQIEIPADLFQK